MNNIIWVIIGVALIVVAKVVFITLAKIIERLEKNENSYIK